MTTELVELADRLIEKCTDYDDSPMKDNEWPRDGLQVGDVRAAANIIRAVASRASVDDELTATRKVLDLLVASGDLTKKRADAAESIMSKIPPCVPDKRCRTYAETRAYGRGYQAGKKAVLAAAPEPVAVGSNNSNNDEESV